MNLFLPNLLKSLEYVFAIVTLLGGVIAIHEFGHFIFAKWAGIRVDMFSIGFGPKLWSRKWGETEYILSLIPLGGFVKIYGQDPEELANDPEPKPERAFVKKSLPQKISVLFGGPLFNYLLAILIFAILAMAGIEKLPPVATRVVNDTPAHQAGLRSGDVIVSVGGMATKTFEDVAEQIIRAPEKNLRFSLLREGVPTELDVKIQKEPALTAYGEDSIAGTLDGINPFAREALVATTLAEHPWGFRTGDKIVEVNGNPVRSWEEVEKNIGQALASSSAALNFKAERKSETVALTSGDIRALAQKSKKDAGVFLENAGLHNPELFVGEVLKDGAASQAGLRAGDRVASVNGKKIYSFEHLRSRIQETGHDVAKLAKEQGKEPNFDQALKLEIEREGKLQTLVSSIRASKEKNLLGENVILYNIGIISAGRLARPTNPIVERTLNPFKALWIGTIESANHTAMTVIGLKKLVFGEVSMKTMGGPILIGKLAGDTFSERGWQDFLRFMAIISISLGVFNLLPLPILDGGHIVFAVIESLRGKPLSQSVQQATLKVGLSLILILMVFAIFNDISRVLPF